MHYGVGHPYSSPVTPTSVFWRFSRQLTRILPARISLVSLVSCFTRIATLHHCTIPIQHHNLRLHSSLHRRSHYAPSCLLTMICLWRAPMVIVSISRQSLTWLNPTPSLAFMLASCRPPGYTQPCCLDLVPRRISVPMHAQRRKRNILKLASFL